MGLEIGKPRLNYAPPDDNGSPESEDAMPVWFGSLYELRRRFRDHYRKSGEQPVTLSVHEEDGTELGRMKISFKDNQSEIEGAPGVGLYPSRNRRAIERWAQQQFGQDIRNKIFVVRTPEDEPPPPEEQQRSTEEEVLREEPAPQESVELPASSGESQTPEFIRKIKQRRQPQRKTRTRAEIKERTQRSIENEYEGVLKNLMEHATTISMPRIKDYDWHSPIRGLTSFLVRNPQFRNRFVELVKNDPAYQPVYLYLALMRVDKADEAAVLNRYPRTRTIRSSRGTMRTSSNIIGEKRRHLQEFKLFDELFPPKEHRDTYRSQQGLEHFGSTNRDIERYRELLFPEFDNIIEFIAYLITRGPERWLDIGSGITYREDNSLMSIVQQINPDIQFIGTDILYSESFAGPIDKALKTSGVERESAEGKQLVAAAVQTLPFEKKSFSCVLSSWVFDKLNEENGSVEQGLRQVARVLEPGGLARIYAIPYEAIKDPLVREYFSVIAEDKMQSTKGKALGSLILEKKDLSEEQEKKLEAEINAWIERYISKRDAASGG